MESDRMLGQRLPPQTGNSSGHGGSETTLTLVYKVEWVDQGRDYWVGGTRGNLKYEVRSRDQTSSKKVKGVVSWEWVH